MLIFELCSTQVSMAPYKGLNNLETHQYSKERQLTHSLKWYHTLESRNDIQETTLSTRVEERHETLNNMDQILLQPIGVSLMLGKLKLRYNMCGLKKTSGTNLVILLLP